MEETVKEDDYEMLLRESLLKDRPEFIERLMNEDNASNKIKVRHGRTQK